MAELEQIYDRALMDHIRNPRHYRQLADATGRCEITNPLCGDSLVVCVRVEGETVMEAGFECSCCGISMGAASMMTEAVTGQTLTQVRADAQQAMACLGGSGTEPGVEGPLWTGLLVAVDQQIPARRTCASLGWQGIVAALDGIANLNARTLSR